MDETRPSDSIALCLIAVAFAAVGILAACSRIKKDSEFPVVSRCTKSRLPGNCGANSMELNSALHHKSVQEIASCRSSLAPSSV